jgi:hypothetical protein
VPFALRSDFHLPSMGSSLYQVGLVIKCVWFRRGGLTRG